MLAVNPVPTKSSSSYLGCPIRQDSMYDGHKMVVSVYVVVYDTVIVASIATAL